MSIFFTILAVIGLFLCWKVLKILPELICGLIKVAVPFTLAVIFVASIGWVCTTFF